jgi:hypothetical protein
MSNPWDVRPPASSGDTDPAILFMCIGQTLTEWSHVETACAEIYAILVSAKGRFPFETPVVRAYGSLPSFSTQCQLVRYAAEAFFHKRPQSKQLHSRLEKLLDIIGKFSPRRNEIAHGQVSQVFLQKSKRSHQMRNTGYYLLPTLYNLKKFDLAKSEITYQYRSSDVIHYRQEFTKLHLQLSAFRDQLKA